MTKPHVLMLTPYLPYPPVSGGRIRTYNLVKYLRDDYDVTLVCFGRPAEQARDWSPLAELCDLHIVPRPESPSVMQAALMSLTSYEPVTMRLYRNAAMRQTLAHIITATPPDVIHVESFYMLQNLPDDLRVPVLLSEPAIEYRAWGQYAKVATPFYVRPGVALEALKMRILEPRVWAQADMLGAMSDVDAAMIGDMVPGMPVSLAPNGVDTDFFHVDETVTRKPNVGLFMADYKYFPNRDAVELLATQIAPRIRAQRPDFHLILLGKNPTPAMQELHGDDITVTGLVDDTRPYLQSSAVFLCPLRSGSGTRNKILESLSCGLPVVSTAIGSEGLGAVDGEHLVVRDDPQAFADAVVDLLDDAARRDQLSRVGREWVVATHSWPSCAALVKEAYATLMTGG